jgi:hypothetical protein
MSQYDRNQNRYTGNFVEHTVLFFRTVAYSRYNVMKKTSSSRRTAICGMSVGITPTRHATEIRITTLNKAFWEELIAYFPSTRHGPNRKRPIQQFVVATKTSLPSCYLAPIGGYTLQSLCLATIGGINRQTHKVTLRPTISRSVRLSFEAHLGLMTNGRDL